MSTSSQVESGLDSQSKTKVAQDDGAVKLTADAPHSSPFPAPNLPPEPSAARSATTNLPPSLSNYSAPTSIRFPGTPTAASLPSSASQQTHATSSIFFPTSVPSTSLSTSSTPTPDRPAAQPATLTTPGHPTSADGSVPAGPRRSGSPVSERARIDSVYAELDNVQDAASQLGFTDLHTHLLGMGHWKFWVYGMMFFCLPRRLQDVSTHDPFYGVEYYGPAAGSQKVVLSQDAKSWWSSIVHPKHVYRKLDDPLTSGNAHDVKPPHKQLLCYQLSTMELQQMDVDAWKKSVVPHRRFGVKEKQYVDMLNAVGHAVEYRLPLSASLKEEVLKFTKVALQQMPLADQPSSTQHAPPLVKYQDFPLTSDVVYDIHALAGALGLDDQLGSERLQHDVAFRLTIQAKSADVTKMLQYYNFFDARKQQFDRQMGITNSDLVALMGQHKDEHSRSSEQHTVFAQIANCFSMLNIDGTRTTRHDLIQRYKGHFTPEFYPRRFRLKDCIYSQFLPTLTLLLHHVLKRYEAAHVTYVEFSVGQNDLSQPWTYRYLVHPAVCASLPPQAGNARHGHYDKALRAAANSTRLETWTCPPRYSFLLGLSRNEILLPIDGQLRKPAPHTDEALKFLIHHTNAAYHTAMNKDAYRSFLHKEMEIRQLLESCQAHVKHVGSQECSILERVVGLDLFGDELGYPYCPFMLDEFLQLAHRFRLSYRVHLGEGVLLEWDKPQLRDAMLAHLYIGMMAVRRIVAANIPCRIGHGVGILACMGRPLPSEDESKMESCVILARPSSGTDQRAATGGNSERNLPASIDLSDWLTPFAAILSDLVLVEVNMTSNSYLLESTDPMMQSLRHVAYVLCTDDEGVWASSRCQRHHRHCSVAAEYCLAISEDIIRTPMQIQQCRQHSMRYTFYPRPAGQLPTRSQLSPAPNAGSVAADADVPASAAGQERWLGFQQLVLPIDYHWFPRYVGARPYTGVMLALWTCTEAAHECLSPELYLIIGLPQFLEASGLRLEPPEHQQLLQHGAERQMPERKKDGYTCCFPLCPFLSSIRLTSRAQPVFCEQQPECTSVVHREVELHFCSQHCFSAHHLPTRICDAFLHDLTRRQQSNDPLLEALAAWEGKLSLAKLPTHLLHSLQQLSRSIDSRLATDSLFKTNDLLFQYLLRLLVPLSNSPVRPADAAILDSIIRSLYQSVDELIGILHSTQDAAAMLDHGFDVPIASMPYQPLIRRQQFYQKLKRDMTTLIASHLLPRLADWIAALTLLAQSVDPSSYQLALCRLYLLESELRSESEYGSVIRDEDGLSNSSAVLTKAAIASQNWESQVEYQPDIKPTADNLSRLSNIIKAVFARCQGQRAASYQAMVPVAVDRTRDKGLVFHDRELAPRTLLYFAYPSVDPLFHVLVNLSETAESWGVAHALDEDGWPQSSTGGQIWQNEAWPTFYRTDAVPRHWLLSAMTFASSISRRIRNKLRQNSTALGEKAVQVRLLGAGVEGSAVAVLTGFLLASVYEKPLNNTLTGKQTHRVVVSVACYGGVPFGSSGFVERLHRQCRLNLELSRWISEMEPRPDLHSKQLFSSRICRYHTASRSVKHSIHVWPWELWPTRHHFALLLLQLVQMTPRTPAVPQTERRRTEGLHTSAEAEMHADRLPPLKTSGSAPDLQSADGAGSASDEKSGEMITFQLEIATITGNDVRDVLLNGISLYRADRTRAFADLAAARRYLSRKYGPHGLLPAETDNHSVPPSGVGDASNIIWRWLPSTKVSWFDLFDTAPAHLTGRYVRDVLVAIWQLTRNLKSKGVAILMRIQPDASAVLSTGEMDDEFIDRFDALCEQFHKQIDEAAAAGTAQSRNGKALESHRFMMAAARRRFRDSYILVQLRFSLALIDTGGSPAGAQQQRHQAELDRFSAQFRSELLQVCRCGQGKRCKCPNFGGLHFNSGQNGRGLRRSDSVIWNLQLVIALFQAISARNPFLRMIAAEFRVVLDNLTADWNVDHGRIPLTKLWVELLGKVLNITCILDRAEDKYAFNNYERMMHRSHTNSSEALHRYQHHGDLLSLPAESEQLVDFARSVCLLTERTPKAHLDMAHACLLRAWQLNEEFRLWTFLPEPADTLTALLYTGKPPENTSGESGIHRSALKKFEAERTLLCSSIGRHLDRVARSIKVIHQRLHEPEPNLGLRPAWSRICLLVKRQFQLEKLKLLQLSRHCKIQPSDSTSAAESSEMNPSQWLFHMLEWHRAATRSADHPSFRHFETEQFSASVDNPVASPNVTWLTLARDLRHAMRGESKAFVSSWSYGGGGLRFVYALTSFIRLYLDECKDEAEYEELAELAKGGLTLLNDVANMPVDPTDSPVTAPFKMYNPYIMSTPKTQSAPAVFRWAENRADVSFQLSDNSSFGTVASEIMLPSHEPTAAPLPNPQWEECLVPGSTDWANSQLNALAARIKQRQIRRLRGAAPGRADAQSAAAKLWDAVRHSHAEAEIKLRAYDHGLNQCWGVGRLYLYLAVSNVQKAAAEAHASSSLSSSTSTSKPHMPNVSGYWCYSLAMYYLNMLRQCLATDFTGLYLFAGVIRAMASAAQEGEYLSPLCDLFGGISNDQLAIQWLHQGLEKTSPPAPANDEAKQEVAERKQGKEEVTGTANDKMEEQT